MTVFITSSPFVDGADRAILCNANGFVDRLREALPPYCRCLFVASDPERHDLTCQFGSDVVSACAEVGIWFSSYTVLDGTNAEDAEELVCGSDFIILAGGHVPTQNAFFQEIHLREILEGFPDAEAGVTAVSGLLAVRLLSSGNETVTGALRALWTGLRPLILGKEPVPPRVWAT